MGDVNSAVLCTVTSAIAMYLAKLGIGLHRYRFFSAAIGDAFCQSLLIALQISAGGGSKVFFFAALR
jgi:hypothetical protein